MWWLLHVSLGLLFGLTVGFVLGWQRKLTQPRRYSFLFHTKTLHDGRRIKIHNLIWLLEKAPIEYLPISKIKGADRYHWSFSPVRFLLCDPECPGIVSPENLLLDGRHRYLRRRLRRKSYMAVRRASVAEIEACLVDAKL